MQTTQAEDRPDPVTRAPRASWYESPWRIAARAGGSALTLVIVALVLGLLLVLRLLGGDSLTVLSGSMEPTFSPGDVVVVQGTTEETACTDVGVGDIITYFPEPNDPTLITHRVVGKTIGTFEDGTSCRFITQGDANSSVDAPVSPAQIRGTFLYGVPGIGWARQWVGEHPLLVAGIAAAGVAGWLLWGNLRRPRTTVMSVPRVAVPGDGAGAPAPGTPTPSSASPPDPWGTDWDRNLRERELALRERELEMRERELALALGGPEGGTGTPPRLWGTGSPTALLTAPDQPHHTHTLIPRNEA